MGCGQRSAVTAGEPSDRGGRRDKWCYALRPSPGVRMMCSIYIDPCYDQHAGEYGGPPHSGARGRGGEGARGRGGEGARGRGGKGARGQETARM